MEPHSPVEEPPQKTSNPLYNLLGGIIAVITLVLPIYITSHYSSSSALTNTSLSKPGTVTVQR
jgi:uncharacterized membrane protein YdcZ (DUF606 family)